jgi:RHS repeat-associated protein
MIEAVRLGNRLTRTDSPSLTPPPTPTDPSTWSYDVANRLLIRPGVTYTYDNNGNTLTKSDTTGATIYGYDYENRLTSVSAPGGITASYAYDPFGRRISKTVNGVMTQYLYDGMNILKEYDGTGTPLATYVHGPGIDQPISMTRGGQTYDYHADGLGSITGLTNSSQTVVQNYGYDGFGNLTQTPTVQNPYTYTGREWDAETGLYYYRARYYDPKVGRFLQQDPIGFAGGDANLYGYVGNSPVNWVDPWGLWYFDVNYTATTNGKFGPGVTGGLQIGPSGVNFYYGFGLGFGKGTSVTFHPFGEMDTCSNVSTGVTFSGGYPIFGIPVGAEGTITTDMNGNPSPDFGVGFGLGFGVSFGPTHTIPLFRW